MSRFTIVRSEYPRTQRTDHVDVLHGVRVSDPYRWLEDVDSDEIDAWTDAQNELTQSVLSQIPFRRAIRERLDVLSSYEVAGLPQEANGRLFFTLQAPDARQPSLCWAEEKSDKVRCLVDPETLADDATVSIAGFAPSPTGRYLAYGLAEAGSDWQVWRVLDVDTGDHLEDRLEWLKFPLPSWREDESGFFYAASRPPAPDEVYKAPATERRLCFHRLGTRQDEDRVVYARPDQPDWLCYGQVTADDRYLVISVFIGTRQENGVSVVDLSSDSWTPVDLLTEFDAAYGFLGNDGRRLFFLTTNGAPLGRIIAIAMDRPKPEHWQELVPESEGTLQNAVYVGGRFVTAALVDAVGRVTVHDVEGGPIRDIELPGQGTVEFLGGRERGTTAYLIYRDYVRPGAVVRHDAVSGETRAFRDQELPFDPADYVTEKHVVNRSDGWEIPVFITRKRGAVVDPQTPTLLYGYGGFNISVAPHFRIEHLAWLDFGGQLAVACVRGGGEFGRAWHQAGVGENRPNVFADFIAVAEWLIETGRTSTPRLAIYGRSNGGLLVGACMTKRPDLFGACLPAVGVLDMLRFHKFTVGSFWTSDYGSPDDPKLFPILFGYSPYHSVRDGTSYPATFVTTADHDDRVFPAHSHKFAAALQAAQSGDAPILLRVDKRAGHGLGKPKGKLLDEIADRWAFTFAALTCEPQLTPAQPANGT